jgi:hypothetical protein
MLLNFPKPEFKKKKLKLRGESPLESLIPQGVFPNVGTSSGLPLI